MSQKYKLELLGMAEEKERFNLSSSGRGEWSLAGASNDDCFNPNSERDLEKLKAWCLAHWTATFRRSVMYGNRLTYHSCCNSFSRRAFVKVAHHPPVQCFNVLQIPSLRIATTAEDLYVWLLEIAKEKQRYGQKVLFPSLNRYHLNTDDRVEVEINEQQEEDSLKKRTSELVGEVERHKMRIKELEKDNARLLHSSKSWHGKYSDLLDQTHKLDPFFMTPRKAKIIDDELFHED
jgi:hypothetical protein